MLGEVPKPDKYIIALSLSCTKRIYIYLLQVCHMLSDIHHKFIDFLPNLVLQLAKYHRLIPQDAHPKEVYFVCVYQT